MISTAIWISSEEARIFKFTPNGVEVHRMHHHGQKHAAEVHGRNHDKAAGDAEHFYHEVAAYLAKDPVKDGSARWLIVGPGLAKTHFRHHIKKHHAQLTKRIIGVETMDKASDGEITNFAHDYFKKLGQFDAL